MFLTNEQPGFKTAALRDREVHINQYSRRQGLNIGTQSFPYSLSNPGAKPSFLCSELPYVSSRIPVAVPPKLTRVPAFRCEQCLPEHLHRPTLSKLAPWPRMVNLTSPKYSPCFKKCSGTGKGMSQSGGFPCSGVTVEDLRVSCGQTMVLNETINCLNSGVHWGRSESVPCMGAAVAVLVYVLLAN
jgi:hypothetical protein